MGRKKIDRSDKVIQTFESSKPLISRLKDTAKERGITVSALIRYILEHYFENRELWQNNFKGKVNYYGN